MRNTSSTAIAIFGCICLAAVTCSRQGPTQDQSGNGSHTGNPAVVGRMYTSDGVTPAAGAKVQLLDVKYVPSLASQTAKRAAQQGIGDVTVIADANGVYRFPVPDSGVYNIFGETDDGLLAFRDSVSIRVDTVLHPDTVVDVGNDTARGAGQIRGYSFLVGQNDTNQVRVTIFAPGTKLITKPVIGGYFSFTKVPKGNYQLIVDPTLNSYHVKVLNVSVAPGKITDLDTVFLYGDSITGMPRVNVGSDTTVSINDTIRLHGMASDPFGRIVRMEWEIGATGHFVSTLSGDTTFIAGATEDTAFKCVFRATDNDGNRVCDTVRIKVLKNKPKVFISRPPNSTMMVFPVNSTCTLTTTTELQFGSIEIYKWDYNGDGIWDDSGASQGNLYHVFTSTGEKKVTCMVRDNGGNTATDTVTILVATELSGILPTSIIFNESSSPYLVKVGTVSPSPVQVIVEPGTTLQFEPGATLNASTFNAQGTSLKRIKILGEMTDLNVNHFYHLKYCDIKKVTIHNSVTSDGASDTITVDSCTFENSGLYGLICSYVINCNFQYSWAIISGNDSKVTKNQFYSSNVRFGGKNDTLSSNHFIGQGVFEEGDSGLTVIMNNIFENCDENGIQINGGSSTIVSNTVTNCKAAGIIIKVSHLIKQSIVSHNILQGNGASGMLSSPPYYNAGIICMNSLALVERNVITANNVGAIGDKNAIFSMNNILNNNVYDYLALSNDIGYANISFNWWGMSDTAQVETRIFDSIDNAAFGTTQKFPVLTAPVPDAGPQ